MTILGNVDNVDNVGNVGNVGDVGDDIDAARCRGSLGVPAKCQTLLNAV